MTQAQTTSIPYNGSGTINIHINNPTASVGGGMPPGTPYMPYPAMPYPYYCYPPNYYLGNLNNGGINQTTNVNVPPGQQGANNGSNGTNISNETNKSTETTNNSKEKKERNIVVLTDNYVKNLENYLRSNNTSIRQTAVKELLMRFKEDKSRIANPSLTALLNLALQDVNASVRAVAMSIIQTGYAKGDAMTEKILQNIQSTKKAYSADAFQAADCLLQMSKTKVKVPDNSHYLDQPKVVYKTKERNAW